MQKDAVLHVALPLPLNKLFCYLPSQEDHAPAVGCRVSVPFGRRVLTGVIVRIGECRDDVPLKRILRVLDSEPLMNEAQIKLAYWLSQSCISSIGECIAVILPSGKRPREMIIKNTNAAVLQSHQLSDEQKKAVEGIEGMKGKKHTESWSYVYGITGSGKTEVYLQLAARCLSRGQGVLYLVPEIALTYQLFAHIHGRFSSLAAMLHSGLTVSERLGEWRRIQRGEARFVIGTRSAVFAPVHNLGLIVIDEEHEAAYKSMSSPRYNARQVALWRGLQEGVRCVMGSATPSVEAWHLMNIGKITKFELRSRVSGGSLPRISIYNLRESGALVSKPLAHALQQTYKSGLQSVLFLNRRGFASAYVCVSCGASVECPHCSVSLVFHKSEKKLICHYCGYRSVPPAACPECRALEMRCLGFGTERIEEELSLLLPQVRVERLDGDAIRRRGTAQALLNRFAKKQVDILLGTQMVAKGLNFPGVKTVGIVMADVGLALPDFRAAERTFSLIVQVAGRAGRFRDDGEVIIQSFCPEHVAIQYAARMKVEAFYKRELALRKELIFPPFSRLFST